MGYGTFTANGFDVVASNALDLIATTQAAGAGMVSANIEVLGDRLHADLGGVSRTLVAQTDKLAGINARGFDALGNTMSKGFSSLEAISGASLAVQAVGFSAVAKQLHSLGGDVRAMHGELAEQGKKLVDLQSLANERLESLVHFASRTLETQEKILEMLVSSKTVEAQQFIRQGWDNLVNGYEDDAFLRFQRSLEYDNTVYVAHAELGRIHERRGEDGAAENHFKRATRFANAAGPKLRAFAHIQFAGFLERKGRFVEGVAEVHAALTVEGVDKPTMGGWNLYRGELMARSGDVDGAVAAARIAVENDDAFFVGAMESAHLQIAQPAVARMLISVDQERRARVVAELESAALAIEHVARLNPDAGTALRREGAALLESTLVARFDQLSGHHRSAVALTKSCEGALQSEIDRIVSGVRVRREAIATSFSRVISLRAPQSTNASEVVIGVSIVIGLVITVATGGLALIVLVPLGVAGLISHSNKRAKETAARAAERNADVAGESARFLEVEDYETLLRGATAKLEGLGKGIPAVAIALDVLATFVPPPLPPSLASTKPTPTPVSTNANAAERVCPHCGGVIKPAAKICKHCKELVAPIAAPATSRPHAPAKNNLVIVIVLIVVVLGWVALAALVLA